MVINMKTQITKDGLLLYDIDNFNISQTLDCGQCFRWTKTDDGCWSGTVYGKNLLLSQTDDGILFYNTTKEEFDSIWVKYFDLERNYGEVLSVISENETLKKAGSLCSGIRILRQEPFEALCSFIISQNNNIPRIKGIIDRLCRLCGECKDGVYQFPTANVLAKMTPEDLAPIRSGFRARYIIDAAKKCDSKEIDFELIKNLPLEEARNELTKIVGVGVKVADCTLLFGLGRIDAFPADVWIKRAMQSLFDGNLPECALPYAGIVQQYIYHYARTIGLE